MNSPRRANCGGRWLQPASYVPEARVRRESAPPAIERMSQEAFELAVSRELAGDCC